MVTDDSKDNPITEKVCEKIKNTAGVNNVEEVLEGQIKIKYSSIFDDAIEYMGENMDLSMGDIRDLINKYKHKKHYNVNLTGISLKYVDKKYRKDFAKGRISYIVSEDGAEYKSLAGKKWTYTDANGNDTSVRINGETSEDWPYSNGYMSDESDNLNYELADTVVRDNKLTGQSYICSKDYNFKKNKTVVVPFKVKHAGYLVLNLLKSTYQYTTVYTDKKCTIKKSVDATGISKSISDYSTVSLKCQKNETVYVKVCNTSNKKIEVSIMANLCYSSKKSVGHISVGKGNNKSKYYYVNPKNQKLYKFTVSSEGSYMLIGYNIMNYKNNFTLYKDGKKLKKFTKGKGYEEITLEAGTYTIKLNSNKPSEVAVNKL